MLKAEQLKQLRLDAGYSQEELAQIIGVSRKLIMKLEANENGSSKEKARRGDIIVLRDWWAACHKAASQKTRRSFQQTLRETFEGLF